MDKGSKKIVNLFVRYIFLLVMGLGNLFIFYKILTPLTVFSTSLILSIFSKISVSGNLILFGDSMILIAPSCVAGAAFYLLFILVFSTANLAPKKRFYVLLTAVAALFILNHARIILLATIISKSYFEVTHWIFWNLISTAFIVGIWFSVIKIYKIKSVPFYTDLISIKSLMKNSKKTKRSKKN